METKQKPPFKKKLCKSFLRFLNKWTTLFSTENVNGACLFVKVHFLAELSWKRDGKYILFFIGRDDRWVWGNYFSWERWSNTVNGWNHLKPFANLGGYRGEADGVVLPCLCREGAVFLTWELILRKYQANNCASNHLPVSLPWRKHRWHTQFL